MRTVSIILLALCAGLGLLAALAWQAGVFDRYLEYRQRSEVIEAYRASSEPRLEVSMIWLERSTLPKDASEARAITPAMLSRPELGVERIEIRGGTIVMTLGGDSLSRQLSGRVLAMSPCFDDRDMIEWACGQAVCGGGFHAATGAPPAFSLTTLPNEWLPASCRGSGSQVLAVRDAAAAGDPDGLAQWGAMLWDGQITPIDRVEGLRMVREAAAAGSADGMSILGFMLANGDAEALPPDAVQAHLWFSRAAALGHPRAKALRDELEGLMDEAQLAEARRLLADANTGER